MEAAALGFVAGCIAMWLYRNRQDRWKYNAVAATLRGVLLGLEHGKDVRVPLIHLARAFEEAK